jgi:hypothetical protein
VPKADELAEFGEGTVQVLAEYIGVTSFWKRLAYTPLDWGKFWNQPGLYGLIALLFDCGLMVA